MAAVAAKINVKNMDYFKFKKIVIDGSRDDYESCSREIRSLCDAVQTLSFRWHYPRLQQFASSFHLRSKSVLLLVALTTCAADNALLWKFCYHECRLSCSAVVEELLDESDDRLFSKTLNNLTHTLHILLPPQSTASQHYHLRRRTHDRQLPTQISHLYTKKLRYTSAV